ncbi:hypothetical protein ACKWTF_013364 [Chironomus riparius]
MEAVENLAKCCGIFQIFGLFYFSIKKLSLKSANLYPSMFYTIHFILILVILTTQSIILAISTSSDITTAINAKNALNYIIQHSMVIGLILVLIIAFIQSYAATREMKKIFVNFIKISHIFLEDFQHIMDFCTMKMQLYKMIFRTMLYYLASQVVLYIYETYYGINISLVRLSIGIFPNIFMSMIIFKFVFFVNLVNYNLSHMTILMQKLFSPQHGPAIINVKAKADKKFERNLKTLRKIYYLVQENVELINKSMGFTILVFLGILVLSLISGGYRIFLTFVGRYPVKKMCAIANIMIFVIIIIHLLVHSCDQTQKHISKLLLTISKIQFENDLKNSELDILRDFHMQIALQPLQFTTAGYYTINLQFLAGIFTGIASYEVILVQFYTS